MATAPIESPIGVIRPGEVAGRRFCWDAVVTNTIVVRIAVNWLMGEGKPQSCLVIRTGRRTLRDGGPGKPQHLRHSQGLAACHSRGGLASNPGIVATAAHCVNSIPAVCAAEPGIKNFFDLPPLTGRAARLLSRRH